MTAALLAFTLAETAEAVDTVETWDERAIDVDFYLGFDGLGPGELDRQLYGDLMIGYGIIDRFSTYLGTRLAGDEQLSNGAGEIYLGVFGTPLDTDHVDLDLFLDLRLGGDGFSEFQVVPALELNLDLAPDLECWGVYLVVGLPLYPRVAGDQGGTGEEGVALTVETVVGTYLTLGSRHQILLDFELAFHPMAAEGELTTEIGGVGLGYNVILNDAIELIVEVRFDIPQRDEELSVGLMAGMIATIPTAQPTASSSP